ncbi:MAG: ACT domain-containing protein [Thermoanaerobaculales bacterium]
MKSQEKPVLGVRLWPQAYAVARLREAPPELAPLAKDDAPVALVIGHGEVSLLAPVAALEPIADLAEHVSLGWRALTLEAVFPLNTVGVLASVSRVLAEVGISVMAFSSHDTDHFLVPAESVGRALAALGSADLERFLPRE